MKTNSHEPCRTFSSNFRSVLAAAFSYFLNYSNLKKILSQLSITRIKNELQR